MRAVAGRQHEAAAPQQLELAREHRCEERRLQHGRRDTGDAASRRSIARWLPCKPASRPAIGMFETFTMCSTPGALGGRDRVGLERDLIAPSASSRGTCRCTPAHASTSDAGSREVGDARARRRRAVGASAGARHRAHRRRLARPARRTTCRAELARRADHEHRHGRAVSRTSVQPVRLPRPGPGIGHELTVRAGARVRAAHPRRTRAGARTSSGHITWATPDGGMWCNPWGIWWDEVRASDILRLDADGDDRRRQVGRHARGLPAHRAAPRARRRDGRRAQPPVLRDAARRDRRAAAASCTRTRASSTASSRSSTSTRGVEDAKQGKWLAAKVGDASGILLAHHGAIVTAPTIGEACYKAATFERMCRFTYDTARGRRARRRDPGRHSARR